MAEVMVNLKRTLLRSLRHPFLSGKQPGLGTGAMVALVVLGVLVVGGLFFAGTYNGLVGADTTVEQKAADLDSQLKRRADLIPNLVSTVKGYASHEKDIFESVANARSRLLSADVRKDPAEAAQANGAFNSALGRLLAIAENYPQLKADQNFIRLQDELTGTENRITFGRIQYNEAVKNYNLKVRSFPTVLLAGMMGFERKASFEATEAEKAVPKVAF